MDVGPVSILHYESVDSTQNVLRRLADEGAPSWTVVVAEHQSEGRGQQGRRWMGAPGRSLTFSLLLRPQGVETMALVPIRCGIAVARALDPVIDHATSLMLKWPNDLMVVGAGVGGKVGGVLCEAQVRGGEACAVIGIGINLEPFHVEVDEGREPAAFLAPLLSRRFAPIELLELLLRSLHPMLEGGGPLLSDAEMHEYWQRDWLRGRELALPVRGRAIGIAPDGALLVALPNGQQTRVLTGRIVLGCDPGV